ncbi:unnamed protein product, partial [Closterium sp. Naga37s-1]
MSSYRAVDSPPRHPTIPAFSCRQSHSAARVPAARSPSAHSPSARSSRRGRGGPSVLPRGAAWLAAVAVA